jgi:2-iminobutanoate/2-iminopropanoate deaminase
MLKEKQVIRTEKAPSPIGPYSQGILAENFIFVAGQAGTDPKTGRVPEDIAGQTRQTLNNIKSIVEAAGSSLENVVRVGVFLRDINDFTEMNKVYQTFFQQNPPARTTIQATLPGKFLVEIDAIAVKKSNVKEEGSVSF